MQVYPGHNSYGATVFETLLVRNGVLYRARPDGGTEPLLDAGAFVAGLEYTTGVEATVLGKPSPAYFASALDALGAEPELTWLVGDDAEADIRPAQLFGMRTALVRTGKFRPDTLERLDVTPDVVLSSIADLPGWLERSV